MTKIKFLTRLELSQELGIRPETLSRWTSRGIIPHLRLGRLVRYDLAEIRKHLIKKSRQNSNG
jgi:excisionase family DNA binding protein